MLNGRPGAWTSGRFELTLPKCRRSASGQSRKLFPCLYPGSESSRPVDKGGNLAHIKWTVEAKTKDAFVLPPDDRRTATRSTFKGHRGSD
jgi:hypothetical protein